MKLQSVFSAYSAHWLFRKEMLYSMYIHPSSFPSSISPPLSLPPSLPPPLPPPYSSGQLTVNKLMTKMMKVKAEENSGKNNS